MTKKAVINQTKLPPIAGVFEEILKTLPAGVATLQSEPQPDGEIYVRLIPRNPAAAKVAARGGGSLRYELIIGEGTLYEIIPDKTYFERPAVEAVRTICAAVFSGFFEETIHTVGRTVARTLGKLTIDGKTYTTRAIHGFYPLIPKRKRIIKYAPYIG